MTKPKKPYDTKNEDDLTEKKTTLLKKGRRPNPKNSDIFGVIILWKLKSNACV